MDTITIKTNDNAVIEMEVVLTYQNNGVDLKKLNEILDSQPGGNLWFNIVHM